MSQVKFFQAFFFACDSSYQVLRPNEAWPNAVNKQLFSSQIGFYLRGVLLVFFFVGSFSGIE